VIVAKQDHGRAGRHQRKPSVTSKSLEAHYLGRRNVPLVIRSLIAAAKAKLDLDFKLAAAIDWPAPKCVGGRANQR